MTMRKRAVYYRAISLQDGTILLALRTRKPRSGSMRYRIGVDGIYDESVEDEEFRNLPDWVKASYHTTIATRLNARRSIRELILPRIEAVEKQLALIQGALDRIEGSRRGA